MYLPLSLDIILATTINAESITEVKIKYLVLNCLESIFKPKATRVKIHKLHVLCAFSILNLPTLPSPF